jgi:hypothetical protein
LYQDFGQDGHGFLGKKNLLSKQVRLRLRDERIDIDLETLVSNCKSKNKTKRMIQDRHDIDLDVD